MKKAALESKALAACIEVAAAAKEVKRFGPLIGEAMGRCESAGSHLSEAYRRFEDEDEYGDMHDAWHGPAMQMEILAACQHCLEAHNAVQDRKKARLRLANARRRITMIGRSA